MGFEYRAVVDSKRLEEVMGAIEARLRLVPTWRVLEGQRGVRFGVRLSKGQPSGGWTEDVTVSADGAGLLVTVHGATGSVRRELVDAVDEALASSGVEGRLEEL